MAPPKTLLHLIDTGGPGGAETIFLNLATGLDPNLWQSIAVVPVRDWLWGALEARGITPVLVPTNGSFDVNYLTRIAQLSWQYRADLIQTHLFSSAVYASVAARLRGSPVVSTFHGPTDVGRDESYRAAKFRILRRKRNRHVFVSENLRQHYAGSIDIASRSQVIYNGIDCDRFQPARDANARRLLGVDSDQLLIGAVGNLRVPKDYPTFLRAAAVLVKRSSRYRFVLVGSLDEPLRSELLALRASLGLNDCVQMPGFMEDIASVMNAFDVYVLSSTSEGFSLTTVEAMACGVPVVATRCGGPEEIVVQDTTGLLVSPADPTALADAIDRLGTDEVLRMRFARAARARAVRDFSIESMLNAYSRLYQAAVGAA